MKRQALALMAGAAIVGSSTAIARDLRVDITNLTNGLYFTPLLVAAHDGETHLFEAGTEAGANLQAMAEGGDISGLIGDVEFSGGRYVADPAQGILGPAETASAALEVGGRGTAYLSITAMLLPTNDGFVGLDGLEIPTKAGSYTYYLHAYDAGTEANDEIVNGGGAPGTPGIPADPGGNSGTGGSGVLSTEHNMTVHIHRGVIGDTDPVGGVSDLDSRVHRWNGPVAKLVLGVSE